MEYNIENYSKIMIVIAARKTEFFNAFWAEFEKKLYQTGKVSLEEVQSFKEYFIRIIENLDIKLFLSENEKQNKRINPSLTIQGLIIKSEIILDEFKKLISE